MSKVKDDTKLVTYSLRLPLEIHTKFKTKLAAERKNMRDVLMEYVVSYLSMNDYYENKKKGKSK